jgi:hypothetical protein
MKVAGTLLGSPASDDLLAVLRRLLPSDVPRDYFDFLQRHNGGDFWPDQGAWDGLGFDYLRLDRAEEVSESQQRGTFSGSPELLVIGTDGGGQWLAFDTRRGPPWPIVMYCPGAPEHLNFLPVADSIAELERKYAYAKNA